MLRIVVTLVFCSVTLITKGQYTQLGQLPTTETLEKGVSQIQLMNRLSSIETPINDYFKERPFNTHLRFNYGLSDGFQLGLGWEAYRQTWGLYTKWQLLNGYVEASNSLGLTYVGLGLTYFGAITYDTELSADRFIYMKNLDRLTYMHQLIVSKWLGERWYLQLSPMFIRQNLVLEKTQSHNQYLLGIGTKYFLMDNLSLALDYTLHMNRNESTSYQDNYSISLDYLWNSLFIQLVYTNAQSANGAAYLVNSEGVGVIGWNLSLLF